MSLTEEELIGKKRKSFAAQKGQVTRAINKLEGLITDPDADRHLMEEFIDSLNQRYKRLENIFQDLSELVDEEVTEALSEELEQYMSLVQDIKVKAKKIGSNPVIPSSHSTGIAKVKLPELQLPKFRGDILEFPRFWDLFRQTVDKDPKLSPVHKFTYLTSYLEDEAADVVKELRITEDNYKKALELLNERYHRPDALIFRHIQSLLHLETKTKGGDDLKMLKDIMDQVNIHVRSLEALGIDGGDYGVILVPLILSRLPPQIVSEWSRKSRGKERDLKFLLEHCNEEIQIKERSLSVIIKAEGSSTVGSVPKRIDIEKEKKRNWHKGSQFTAAALAAVGSTCIFCKREGHDATVCRTVRRLTWEQIKEIIQKSGVCYRCLQRGHIANNCSSVCSQCGKGHHTNICRSKIESCSNNGNRMPNREGDRNTNNNTALGVSCVSQTDTGVIMQMVRVRAGGLKADDVTINMLFDTGSNRTYIKKDLADKMGCKKIKFIQHQVTMFGGQRSPPSLRAVREVKLTDQWGNVHTIEALETPEVCAPLVQPRLRKEDIPPGMRLASLPSGLVKVEMLVGLDYYYKFMGDAITKVTESLVAHNTPFGYIISGATGENNSKAVVSHQLFVMTNEPKEYWNNGLNLHCKTSQGKDASMEQNIRRLWNLETFGIPDHTIEEDNVFTKFKKELKFDLETKRYIAKLPWKPNSNQLQNNENTARKRFLKQISKLSAEQLKLYMKVFEEWEDNNMIEEVPAKEVRPPGNTKIFYLPHRPVMREDSLSTKIRPVFDGSASDDNGLSINDVLYTGPKLQNDIVDILIRFRTHPVALNADISKAFLQIQLDDEDKDCCRFFLPNEDGSVRIMRFRRLPFGLNTSPFILNATLKVHLSKYSDNAAEQLAKNLYVDDWLSGEDTLWSAQKLYGEADKIMKEASMPLAKWRSNIKEVKDDEIPDSKVLGLFWDSKADEFLYSGIEIPDDVIITKRLILSCIAKVYDPLGYLSPYLIKAKILFQQAWFQGLDWDEISSPEIAREFRRWIEGLQQVKREFKVQRQYIQNTYSKEEKSLIVFCDASEQAYGTAIYLKTNQGLSFISAKARVAPLKKVSLPRLELIACVMGTQMLCKVKKALELEEIQFQCYTDSMIALHYIKQCPDKWKPFIANRVRSIQDVTAPSNWSHIPGEKNPADALTRGIPATKFISGLKDWINPCLVLPSTETSDSSDVTTLGEIEVEEQRHVLTVAENDGLVPFIPIERWSTLNKALRIVTWVRRFIWNCQHRNEKLIGAITSIEIAQSKEMVIKHVQQMHFKDEINLLKTGKTLLKGSKLHTLTPFIDDKGILRIRGRLENSELTFEAVHPIILPKDWFSRLLVREYHTVLKHAGVGTLINTIRQTYWIIGLRRVVKEEVKACIKCQRIHAPACNQESPPLPKERVIKQRPFAVTGIDFAGPLYVTDSEEKQYICLFTCMTIRGVHLEVTSNLSSQEFLKAFRRFASRKGLPKTICSDNARTFIKASEQLSSLYGDQTPQWKFITPTSPWKGGCWERLVRTVKTHLKKVLGNQNITKVELETLLTEIEYVINTRPLTTVTDMPEDIRPLTPADFLLMREGVDASTSPATQKSFANGLKQVQRFWKLWSLSYLKGLPHLVPQFRDKGNIQIGSVVLVEEDNIPRLKWPLARIIELIPSQDGRIRTVKVLTGKGTRVRSVQRLHLLEGVQKRDDEPKDDPLLIPVTKKNLPMDKAIHSSLKALAKPRVTTRSGRRIHIPKRYQ